MATLVRVTAPHFCAGLILKEGRCTRAAPILKWAVGMERDKLRKIFYDRKWQAMIIDDWPDLLVSLDG